MSNNAQTGPAVQGDVKSAVKSDDKADWLMVEPGLYADGDSLHLFAAEFLRGHGIADNEHNRRMIEWALKQAFPGVPVHEVTEA